MGQSPPLDVSLALRVCVLAQKANQESEEQEKGVLTRERTAWWLVLGLVTLYALFFSAYTIQRHEAFMTSAFDLGNFDQAIWNTAHARPFAITNIPNVTHRFAHHVEPILLLIAPLYWLWSDVRLLLILQSVAIAAGAIPLFWYASRQVGAEAAVMFVAIYLLFPALEGANLFDFHGVTLAPFFLLLAWHYLNEQQDRPFLVAALLAAMTKEEIGLIIGMMGLYALLIQRRRFGLLPFCAGVGWFLLILEVISPAFNQAGQHEFIGFYSQWGNSGLEVAFYLLTHPLEVLQWLSTPERLTYLRDLLTPTLGISLLAPHVLLMALPSFAVNLLSSYPVMTILEGYHYPAPLVPFVVLSGVTGLRWLAERLTRLPKVRWSKKQLIWAGSLSMLIVTLIYHVEHGATPLAREWKWPVVTPHHQIGDAIIASIPPESAVSAQSSMNPHLSQREKIYRFPEINDAQFILFDITTPSLFFHPNDLRREIETLLASGNWGVQEGQDGWLLLARCESGSLSCSTALPDSVYSYARVTEAIPHYSIDAQFGDALRLRGYDLERQGEETQLRLYWQSFRFIDEPLRLWPVFYDPTWSTVIEDTSLRPLMETVWYPPQLWKPAEIVQTTTLPWDIGESWNLAVTVLTSDDPASARLPFTITSSEVVPEQAKEHFLTLLKVRDGQLLADSMRRFTPPSTITPIAASLEDGLSLIGSQFPAERQPGDTLPITLAWQAGETPPQADYTAFVQLLGPEGLIAQSDAYPTSMIEGMPHIRPTTTWMANEVVLDQHNLILPDDLSAGHYRLIVGLYDLARDGLRLSVSLHGVALPDSAIPLGEVQVY